MAPGCPAPTNSELKADNDMTERMGATVEGNGYHSDVTVHDGPKHKVVLAEPVEDGGSGKGPNPMEALISSFAICEFEQSLVIAKEKGVKNWVLDMDASLLVNLDGYMNKSPGMHAKDVFVKMKHDATITTEADQATIDKIFEETVTRCPLTRLFSDAGAGLEGKWTKAA